LRCLRCSTKLLSSWLTVAITLERLLTVSVPLKFAKISTPRNARLVIVALSIICLAITVFPFWTLGVRQQNCVDSCVINSGKRREYDIWFTVIVRVGSLIVPGILLIICTVLIINGLLARSRQLGAEVGLSYFVVLLWFPRSLGAWKVKFRNRIKHRGNFTLSV